SALRGYDLDGILGDLDVRFTDLAAMLEDGSGPRLPPAGGPADELLIARVEWLWGESVARGARRLVAQASYVSEAEKTLLHGVSGFQAIVRNWVSGIPARDGATREVVRRLEHLPFGAVRPAVMASILFDLLEPRLRSGLPSSSAVATAIAAPDDGDDVALARALGGWVVAFERARPAPAPRPRPVHRKARDLDLVAATGSHPSLELRLPGDARDAMMRWPVDMALERRTTHHEVVWATVVECGQMRRGDYLPAPLDGRLLAEAWRIGLRDAGWLPDD